MNKCKLILTVLLTCVVGLAHADRQEEAARAANAGDYKTAITIWRSLADQGDTQAMFLLGSAYEKDYKSKSYGVMTRNYTEAAKWYLKGANLGDISCLYSLANAYNAGYGVIRNDVIAYMLYDIVYLTATGNSKGIVTRHDLTLIARSMVMTPAEIAKGQELAAQWKPGMPLPTSSGGFHDYRDR